MMKLLKWMQMSIVALILAGCGAGGNFLSPPDGQPYVIPISGGQGNFAVELFRVTTDTNEYGGIRFEIRSEVPGDMLQCQGGDQQPAYCYHYGRSSQNDPSACTQQRCVVTILQWNGDDLVAVRQVFVTTQ